MAERQAAARRFRRVGPGRLSGRADREGAMTRRCFMSCQIRSAAHRATLFADCAGVGVASGHVMTTCAADPKPGTHEPHRPEQPSDDPSTGIGPPPEQQPPDERRIDEPPRKDRPRSDPEVPGLGDPDEKREASASSKFGRSHFHPSRHVSSRRRFLVRRALRQSVSTAEHHSRETRARMPPARSRGALPPAGGPAARHRARRRRSVRSVCQSYASCHNCAGRFRTFEWLDGSPKWKRPARTCGAHAVPAPPDVREHVEERGRRAGKTKRQSSGRYSRMRKLSRPPDRRRCSSSMASNPARRPSHLARDRCRHSISTQSAEALRPDRSLPHFRRVSST